MIIKTWSEKKWIEIQGAYPKSCKLLKYNDDLDKSYWHSSDGVPMKDETNNRWLYDFFDDQKIYITTGYEESLKYNSQIKDYQIYHSVYPSRSGVEDSIFPKAFEILEKKL